MDLINKSNLLRFINGGSFSNVDMMLSLIADNITYRKNYKKIFQGISPESPVANGKLVNLSINKYKGKNPLIQSLTVEIEKLPTQFLTGVYVHGSVGTYEEVNYSDLDALIIINDIKPIDKKLFYQLLKGLSKARKWMYKMDPLQHHGWFVLLQSELKNYPQHYFPYELFEYAKSLGNYSQQTLEICFDNSKVNYQMAIEKLLSSLIVRIKNNYRPTGMYAFKNLLSEIMLLPAFYCQAKYKRGFFKAETFDLAKKDFDSNLWSAIELATNIRAQWQQNDFPSWMLYSKPFYRQRMKYYDLPLPTAISNSSNEIFYQSILVLCEAMQEKILAFER
ncbi:MAG: hypothetical protein RIQ89_747 [Bacteroidota bacterium]|jgi:hypothetical protein